MMKVYRYKKQIAFWCIFLGMTPFVVTFIGYSVSDVWTDFDKRVSIWLFVVCLFFICIALAVLVGRNYMLDSGKLYHYHSDRLLWKADMQNGQSYVRMLAGYKTGRFIQFIYVGDEKIHNLTISACDYLEDLYIELCKYNDPDMPERYPKEFKMFRNIKEVPYEDVAQNLKEYKGNQA